MSVSNGDVHGRLILSGSKPGQIVHLNQRMRSGMDCCSNPMVEVRVPLHLVQDAVGRLDEQVRWAHMHMEQQEDRQEHEHDENSYKHNKQARGESAR
jgi:hypothetical protein